MDRSVPPLVPYAGHRGATRFHEARRATFIAHEAWPVGCAGAFVQSQGGFLWFDDVDSLFAFIGDHLTQIEGQVGWWGPFANLRSGDDSFTRGIRADFYFEVFGVDRSDAIPRGHLRRFVGWLRDWGL